MACGARAAGEPEKLLESATLADAWAVPGRVDTGGRVVEKVPRAVVKRAGKIERDATLKADEVARTIRRGMNAIKGCYQRALKRNPKLSGKIAIRLVINPTGKVTDVEIETDSVGDSQVTSCIVGYARRWRFPPPEGGGTAEVAVPFVFQAAELAHQALGDLRTPNPRTMQANQILTGKITPLYSDCLFETHGICLTPL